VTGKCGHANTCSGGYDDVISSAGVGGGVLLRSDESGHAWARPGERYKNPCATAVERTDGRGQRESECGG